MPTRRHHISWNAITPNLKTAPSMESHSITRRLWLTVLALNLIVCSLAGLSLRATWKAYVDNAETATQNLALAIERELAGIFAAVDVSLLTLADDFPG